MNRITLQASAYLTMGLLWSLFGILIFIGPNPDFSNILRACAVITFGIVTCALGFERILNYKLDVIHQHFGPYQTWTFTLFDIIRGFILVLFALCAYVGGTILNLIVFFRHWPVQYYDLAIVLLPLGLAFWSLFGMYVDSLKYDDIGKAIGILDQRNGEHDRTYNIFDFIPHGEIPPGLECDLPSPL